MEYDIVIATRNRAPILEVSIPLMLSQGRRPRRVIVVDSSDDDQAVPKTLESISAADPIDLKYVRSEIGSAHQRNVGLRSVISPVVMFPDDDSLWLPGVADAVMRIYELDQDKVIGAVCAAEALSPPPGVFATAKRAYEMSWKDRLKLKIERWRNAMEQRFAPDPCWLHGKSRWTVRPVPPWLAAENAVLVEYMTGFRMSFRTDLIHRCGFDEALTSYSLFEDVEASFTIMRTHLIIGARHAQVFHYRSPGKRTDGRRRGAFEILNRAYVVSKHSPQGSVARSLMRRYGHYKLAQYALACHTPFGRERFRGAWRALKCLDAIVSAPAEFLPREYTRQLEICTK